MSGLREILQSSSAIATGSIIAHGRRKYLEPVQKPCKEDTSHKPSGMSVSYKSPEEVEVMLAAQFGTKLQAKRDRKDFKVPAMIELADMNMSPASVAKRAERKKAARVVLEPAKLQPKHLTPDRLKELVNLGKAISDIAKLYNASEQTVKNKASEWGLSKLLKKAK